MKDNGEVQRIIRYFKGTDEVSTLYIFGSLTVNESEVLSTLEAWEECDQVGSDSDMEG